MASIAEQWHRLGILWARSRQGLSQEEAKKLFFQFRKKSMDGSGPEPEPEDEDRPEADSERALSQQMQVFMQETSQKLDRIENDIDYLKNQVDNILKKI